MKRDPQKYRTLIERHRKNPESGLSDADIDWLLEYRAAFPDDEVVLAAQQADGDLNDFLSNAATAELEFAQQAVDEHSDSIDAILAEYKSGANIVDSERPRQFLQRSYYRWLAVAIVIVALLGGWLYVDSQAEEIKRQFAENSIPHPGLDAQVNDVRRNDIDVIAPRPDEEIDDIASFEWRGSPATHPPFVISIYSNQNSLVLQETIEDEGKILFLDLDELPPGLYYWKLEDGQQLYHVGRFFLNRP